MVYMYEIHFLQSKMRQFYTNVLFEKESFTIIPGPLPRVLSECLLFPIASWCSPKALLGAETATLVGYVLATETT